MRGQAPLCPHRRPPRPQHPIVSVFRRGGLHFGRHTNQSHARTATKWGELRCERCTVELGLRRAPPAPRRAPGLATAPAGGDPTTSRHISHVISPRSLFETTQKRCNSNDMDSTFELIAGELRAELLLDSHSWASGQRTQQHQPRRPHRRGGVAGVNSVSELPASQAVWPIKPMSAIFHRGGLHCGRHATPNRDLTASKRGELHH